MSEVQSLKAVKYILIVFQEGNTNALLTYAGPKVDFPWANRILKSGLTGFGTIC